MNKQIVNEYLEVIEKSCYNIKLDLFNNKIDQAYLKITGLNNTIASLLFRLASETTEVVNKT